MFAVKKVKNSKIQKIIAVKCQEFKNSKNVCSEKDQQFEKSWMTKPKIQKCEKSRKATVD
jgi:hypothetical protein